MFVVVQFIFFIKIVFGAQLFNCPRENVKFEKILGLRPSRVTELLLYRDPNQLPITLQCLSKCGAIPECQGFVLDYRNSTCYWYRDQANTSEEFNSIIQTHVAWFLKTCLTVTHCSKLWTFERAPGATLVGNDVKIVPQIVSRQECQQRCLNETNFVCRSAKYTIGHLNGTETVGKCVLSDTDRILAPSSFRVSRSEEEYFGNQCSPISRDEFCSFEEYENVTLAHADIQYKNKSKEECASLCEKTTEFSCRGYSLLQSPEPSTCLIHSEDSKIHGPKLLLDRPSSTYFERAPCLNISVTCSDKTMIIRYQPKMKFEGKIYMQGFSEEAYCYTNGRDTDLLVLDVPLRVGTCGINLAKDALNSTLLYSTMIVQYNPVVQTQADRVVRIGCIYGNATKVVLGTGVNFTTAFPNTGSTLVNATGNVPHVMMRIVDFETQKELSETRIGQELQLIIEAQSTNEDFDISAGHLVAMTDNGQDSILLLDDRGCPTNLNIFPLLTKVSNKTTRRLIGTFQAFKFSSSSIIRFSIIVQFCSGECPRVDCGNYISRRTKRDLTNFKTTVESLEKQYYDIIGKEINEIPLELNITVKNGGDASSDKYIFGTNTKLLVADFEYGHICLEKYILISLIILWILITILLVACGYCIIRRYKNHFKKKFIHQSLEELNRNFGLGYSNLGNRKVHFANGAEYE